MMQDRRLCGELEEEDPYIGVLEGRPPPAYNVATDLHKGFYVFVRPAHGCVEPVWLGRATDEPQFDPTEDHFREVPVQWYIPCGTSKDIQTQYAGWDTKPNFRWKIDPSASQADYVSTDSIMASWHQNTKDGTTFRAKKKQVKFAVDNLRRIIEEERGLVV